MQVVRAPVALAMVKLLKLLPEEAMTHQLPQALQGVAHLLRNRLQRIRYYTAFVSSSLNTEGAFHASEVKHVSAN